MSAAPDPATVLADEPFAFRLTLKRGDRRAFVAPSAPAENQRILAERRHWLSTTPKDYFSDGGEALKPVWAETAVLLNRPGASPRELAESLEPDWVLMVRDNAGKFRVRGGVVVFPSHWSLPEKVGLTLLETHGVVPGLNAAVGTAIDRFLDRLKPGTGAERYNWGLAATAELNLHPALSRPRLSGTPDPNGTWLRVEHQILFVLPDTAAIVFGIRIHLFPLAEILQSRQIKTGLHRILTSMPPTLQTYKGLTPAMPWLLDVTS